MMGINTDPGILVEIEDIEAKIVQLQEELRQIESQVDNLKSTQSPSERSSSMSYPTVQLSDALRQRRPGYDRIFKLLGEYQEIAAEKRTQIRDAELERSFLVPLFQALGWSVTTIAGFKKENSLFDLELESLLDLELEYRDLRIPVEVKKVGEPLRIENSGVLRIWRGEARWSILTNFQRIQIWNIEEAKLILETSPSAYVSDGNQDIDLLAAQVFYSFDARYRPYPPSSEEGGEGEEEEEEEEEEENTYLNLQTDGSEEQPLDYVRNISDPDEQSQAIINLAPSLTEDQVDEALKLVVALEEKKESAANRALVGLFPYLPATKQVSVANRMGIAAREITDKQTRAEILTELIYFTPESEREYLVEEALSTWVEATQEAKGAENRIRQAKSLRELEPYLSAELKAQIPPDLLKADEPEQDQQPPTVTPPANTDPTMEIAIRALADKPSEVDLLGFKDYAAALADFIKSEKTEKPLVIGIDAAWGMGKTTLMGLIRKELSGKEDDRDKKLNFPPANEAFFWLVWEMFVAILKKSVSLVIELFKIIWKVTLYTVNFVKEQIIRGWIYLVRVVLKKAIKREVPETVAKIKKTSFPTVWFNAWKYDEEESLWAALVLEILAQVRQQLNWRQRIGLAFKLNWKRFDWGLLAQRVGRYLTVYIFLVGILGLLIVGVASLWLGATLVEVGQQLWRYAQLVGGLGFLTAVYATGKEAYERLANPFELKLENYLRTPDYAEKVGFIGQFEADFKRVIDVVTENGKWPLIVFIDDLDRCAPPKPVEIIEAINLLLDSQHCVFILGMDSHTVAGSIEAKYKDLLEKLIETDTPGNLTLGQRFLEKIVQINFRIPRTDPAIFAKFVEVNLGVNARQSAPPEPQPDVDQAEELIKAEQRAGITSVEAAAQTVQKAHPDLSPAVIQQAQEVVITKSFDDSEQVREAIREAVPYLNYNPRKIKRFINLLRLQALIAHRRGLLEKDVIELKPLSKWLLIATLWPGALGAIAGDPEFAERLSDALKVQTELHRRRSEDVTSLQLKDLDIRAEQLKNIEAKVNEFRADPLINQLLPASDLAKLLAELDVSSPHACAQYIYLAQTSVERAATTASRPPNNQNQAQETV